LLRWISYPQPTRRIYQCQHNVGILIPFNVPPVIAPIGQRMW
jgi:hypothetical protein